MVFESVLTLVPAFAAMALAAAAIFIGYAAVSCSVARVQGKECGSC
jgi:hypothetical protein